MAVAVGLIILLLSPNVSYIYYSNISALNRLTIPPLDRPYDDHPFFTSNRTDNRGAAGPEEGEEGKAERSATISRDPVSMARGPKVSSGPGPIARITTTHRAAQRDAAPRDASQTREGGREGGRLSAGG